MGLGLAFRDQEALIRGERQRSPQFIFQSASIPCSLPKSIASSPLILVKVGKSECQLASRR
jgi:hypothetical protein